MSLRWRAKARVAVIALPDHRYNHEAWIRNVQQAVNQHLETLSTPQARIGLIETQGQQPSYQQIFPHWPLVTIEALPHWGGSALRSSLLDMDNAPADKPSLLTTQVPEPVSDFILKFRNSDGFEAIKAEHQYVQDYKTAWAAAPYDPGSVGDAVAAAFPAIEIVDSRFQDWTTIGPAQIIADNGSHGAWVHGAPVSDWQDIDLAEMAVQLYADGELVREGQGINVMDHPLNALTWLANVRAVYARDGLKAGDRVSTGTTIVVYDAKKGQHLKADFGALGSIELTLE